VPQLEADDADAPVHFHKAIGRFEYAVQEFLGHAHVRVEQE
jgi:hypothetical protein